MLVRALGPLQVQPDASTAGGADPPSLGGPRQRAVMACLVVHAGEQVAPATVVDAVWPDEAPASATGTLQAYVSRLRTLLGRDRLRHTDGTYRLRLARDELDEWVLSDALDAVERHGRDETAQARLVTALGLWRGRPLGDLADAAFCSAYVAGLESLHVRALCAASRWYLEHGQPDSAVDLLRRGAVDHPYEESLVVGLMRAHAHAGQTSAALGCYRDLRDRLRRDLGSGPSPQVSDLASRIAAADPAASQADVSRRRHARAPQVDLPEQPAPVVGRRGEIEQISRTATRARATTLTGPPGVGKTRLAVECGWRLSPRAPGGVVLVPLEGVRTPAALHAALLAACEVTPAAGIDPARALRRALSAREPMLLLLDCADHLDADASTSLSRLLDQVPSLRVLATSVAPLGIDGEAVVEVPPLTVPDSGGRLLDSESGRLLVHGAQRAQPGFAVTPANEPILVEVVRRLDGLPLAVELAAGQLAVLGPAQLLRRLGDRFAVLLAPGAEGRHVSLRAAISSAVDELSPLQHEVLLRLGVTGGRVPTAFADDLVSDVRAGADVSGQSVLGQLARRSLLTADAEGVTTLESVREYAAERLVASGQWHAAVRRHADVLAAHLCRAAEEAHGENQGAVAGQVRSLRTEVRTALHRLPDAELAGLAALAVPWWFRSGDLADVVDLGQRVCGADAAGDADAAAVLGHAALAEALSGADWTRARAWSTSAVDRARTSKDPSALARARLLRGDLRTVVGDWPGAVEDLDSMWDGPGVDPHMTAFAELRRLRVEWATGPLTPVEHGLLDRRVAEAIDASGDPLLAAQHDLMRAQLIRHHGQLREAQGAAERLVATSESLQHRPLTAVARLLLADTASRRGEWDVAAREARRLLRGGQGLAAPFPRDPREVLARCAANQGDFDAARDLCAAVARDATARGHHAMLAVLAVLESDLCLATDPSRAAAALKAVAGADLPIWYRLEVALAWAAVHTAFGDVARAQRAWETASGRPEGYPMRVHQVRLALVAAELAAGRGDTAGVSDALNQRLSVADEAGYVMPRWERERVERLLSR